jgi:hypothetical protein
MPLDRIAAAFYVLLSVPALGNRRHHQQVDAGGQTTIIAGSIQEP